MKQESTSKDILIKKREQDAWLHMKIVAQWWKEKMSISIH
jgi:hypothetical protein